jgi:hypothetical protein
MARARFERPELPDESDPNFMDKAIDACIAAYKILQDDTTALNYMGIKGRIRPIVLKNERYITETRKYKADLMMETIEDTLEMMEELETEEVNATKEFDIRNATPGDVIAMGKDAKERFNQKLKLQDRLADMRNMTKEKENEEVDALNIFFIPLTAQEFQQMQNVEINEGHDADDTLKSDKKKEELQKAAKVADDDDANPFRLDAEGNLIGM